MKVSNTRLPEVKIIDPQMFEDERGFFFESFNQQRFEEVTGCSVSFVQDNHLKSSKGVLRGLHYQLSPKAQGKLVRVVQGEVFDVAVDIRERSLTFGHWVGEILSAENKRQLWIPSGFAHGFLTISDSAEVIYKTTDYFDAELERSVCWDDPSLNIKWPSSPTLLSVKDKNATSFENAEVFL